MHAYIHTYTYTHTYTYIHTHIYMYIHTHIYIRRQTYIHIYTYIHAHIYTHIDDMKVDVKLSRRTACTVRRRKGWESIPKKMRISLKYIICLHENEFVSPD